MALTIGWWTVDVEDAATLAPFYEGLLGWERLFEDPTTGIAFVPPGELRMGGHGLLLYTDHTTGAKTTKNPAHLDLRPADQHAEIVRAITLGAEHVDVGQGDVSWAVLADPAGNEFCILAADGSVSDGLELEAWALDVADVDRAARFWSGLLGWEETEREDGYVRLRDPAGEGIPVDLLRTPDERATKNRVHPDLIPFGEEDDADARPRELERALDLGATRADIGQGDAPWEVLVDPEGNEFCILGPRGWQPATE